MFHAPPSRVRAWVVYARKSVEGIDTDMGVGMYGCTSALDDDVEIRQRHQQVAHNHQYGVVER